MKPVTEIHQTILPDKVLSMSEQSDTEGNCDLSDKEPYFNNDIELLKALIG